MRQSVIESFDKTSPRPNNYCNIFVIKVCPVCFFACFEHCNFVCYKYGFFLFEFATFRHLVIIYLWIENTQWHITATNIPTWYKSRVLAIINSNCIFGYEFIKYYVVKFQNIFIASIVLVKINNFVFFGVVLELIKFVYKYFWIGLSKGIYALLNITYHIVIITRD